MKQNIIVGKYNSKASNLDLLKCGGTIGKISLRRKFMWKTDLHFMNN